ncbi:meiotic recombination protein REC114 isoform X2 [Mixophyes fleayi]|uniref:meiotic recombination protein REC114 isoform X2 n=1 Tax=Mixophyes fleayi TaxID=3061075 RepID=UPI003F4D9A8D
MAAASSGVVGQGEEWVLQRYGRLGTPGEKNETSAQRREGFSLISAKSWLKVGKNSDCLLFGTKAKDESRMFRVQFNGESKEKAQENCDRCFQRLQYYLTDQNESSQTFREERIHVAQVAESMLSQRVNDLGTTYQYPALSVVELGSFLKLCLLDKDFPAFVEAVEQELNKLTQK